MVESETTTTGRVLVVGPGAAQEPLATAIEPQGWDQILADTANEAIIRMRIESPIDLVIIRPQGQLESGIELCRYVKLEPGTALVPVIFVLEERSDEQCTAVFRAGADDCIQLPTSTEVIVARLRNAIRVKHATDSLEDASTVITALANAVEGKDAYTCGHVERVAAYSLEIAKRFDLDAESLSALRIGAMVHDIGKVSIPDHILNKPGKLTRPEMFIMKRHPVIGYDILQPMRTFRHVLPIVRWHHERPNGAGYPDGLAGDDLPLLPRIVAVADCFDALSTDRPYRPALPLDECKEILRESVADQGLDPAAVAALVDILEQGAEALVGLAPIATAP